MLIAGRDQGHDHDHAAFVHESFGVWKVGYLYGIGLVIGWNTDGQDSIPKRHDGSGDGDAHIWLGQVPTSKLPPGANSITAVYEGDSKNNGSTSAPVNQVVLAATTTTLTSSPNPSAFGETVTFTAAVTSMIGSPPDGETVSFMKGTTVLGTGTLSGGSATFTTSTLEVGTTSVTAVYAGDSDFAPSTSKAVKQVVEKAAN